MNRKFTLLLSLLIFGVVFQSLGQDFCPDNINFEDGSLTNWHFFRGQNRSIGTVAVWSVSPTSAVSTLHTLTSGSGVDAYGGFPVVAPAGGGHSLKLGKDSSNFNADGASYYLHIPSGTTAYSLVYNYAMVLENPTTTPHLPYQQPRMVLFAVDSATGDTIPCAKYNYVSSSSDPGFIHVSGDIYYKNWTAGNMKFPGENGRTVTVTVLVGGCTEGGHWGYGYFDMSCGAYAVSTISCGSTTETLSAPGGYTAYSWKDSATFTTSYGTTQTVSVPVPSLATTYAVILTPYTGYGCLDTLYTRVEPSNLVLHGSNDTAMCRGGTAPLTATATDIALPLTYVWSPALGLSCTTCSSVVASPTVTTKYAVRVTDAAGCWLTDTMKVTIYANPVPITGPGNLCTGVSTTLTDTSAGGRWSSSNTSVATIGSGTGLVTLVSLGTTIISYTIGGMCVTTRTETVYSTPPPITGTPYVCPFSSTTLSDATSGGTWTSSSTGRATVGSGTGVVTGVAAGTALISYIITATGCYATDEVTVNPLPAAIVGLPTFCMGQTTLLTDGTSGGSWSSADVTVATAGTTGIITGVAAGTTVITYTLPTGCQTAFSVTVNPLPTAISGTLQVCPTLTTSLGDAMSGGTWSSQDMTVATIGSTGVVTGVFQGTTTITYTLSSTGCFTMATLTVNPTPNPISGVSTVCLGFTTTLSDIDPGGTWSCFPTSTATVGISTGVVTGVAYGAAICTYRLPTGCLTTIPITVYPNPGAISGTTTLCVGTSATLSDGSAGGTWWCGSSGVISVVTGTGLVTGSSSGTAIITYMLSTGCFTTATITVLPSPSAITGPTSVCVGANVALTNAVSGGTWSSSDVAVGTIIPSSGVLTGIAPGSASITYSLGGTCRSTRIETVLATPAGIGGPTNVCAGSTIALTDASSGGTWSSASVAVGTVSSSGVFGGVSAGTVIITYKLGDGCFSLVNVTVNPMPAPITGATNICHTLTVTLSDAVGSGIWSCTGAVASVGATTGVVTGSSLGTTIITYSIGSCRTTTTVTVNPLPAPITGTLNVCVGATTTLGDATTGGSWISSNISVATVGSLSGIVAGLSSGSTLIIYELPTGCSSIATLVVNITPALITGPLSVCSGNTVTLSDATSSGSWISGNTAVGTIGSSSGILYGVSAGTTAITYTLGTSCIVTRIEAVNISPATPTGPSALCVGANVSLGDAITGGTWTSGATGIATIGASSGLLHGVALGTSIITYTAPGGCFVLDTISVSPTPTAIVGVTPVCSGATVLYTDGVPGGIWTSSDVSVAAIGSTSGWLTGGAVGTAMITYSLGSGCTVSKSVAVIASPAGITGVAGICAGTTTSLSDLTTGGTWASSNVAVGTVGLSSGVFSGIGAGTAVVSYIVPSGCSATITVTVSPTPSAITGVPYMCSGTTTTLSDLVSGGLWMSSATTIASVGSVSGIVSGALGGTATITYTLGGTCAAYKLVTVYASPTAIGGPSALCLGASITLTDAVTGGTWISSNTAVASIGLTSGGVSGLLLGTTIITYTAPGSCFITTTITVSPTPTAITGTLSVCAGSTSTLGDGVPGGTWVLTGSSSIATIGSLSGMVTGIAPGTSAVTYSLGSGCTAVATLTVTPTPSAISGPASLCVGQSVTLGDVSGPGTWNSGNITVATIGLSSGVVYGASAGSSLITYTIGDGCVAFKTVTVNPLPRAISGTLNICMGQTTALTDSATGGSWISGTIGVATVGYTSGIVSGLTSGTSIITYTITGGCNVTAVVTVNPTPAAISGLTSICAGSTTLLSDVASGGTWGSGAITVATAGSLSGVVFGVMTGSAIITYSLGAGCSVTTTLTVKDSPLPIIGSANMCVATTVDYSDLVTGGTWTSSTPTVATIGLTSGVVTGVGFGTTMITYKLLSNCFVTQILTVNPTATPISVPAHVCAGTCYTLTDAVSGGSWTSTSTGVATIGATSGLICAVAPGSTIITYSIGAGCTTSTTINVQVPPAGITGVAIMCQGSNTTLSDVSGAGTWASGSTGVATIVPTSGYVTGVSGGTAMITYTIGDGCMATTEVTVNPVATIGGPSQVCQYTTITLTDAVPSGTWASSTVSVATIDVSSGILAGVLGGTTTVTYTTPAGCITTTVITVNPAPSPISGTSNVCIGQTTHLTDLAGGGTWSSSRASVATVGASSGIVSGIIAGTTVISYRLSTGCGVNDTITVNPLPGPILGIANLCAGSTLALSDITTGGSWSVTGGAIIGSVSGIITGLSGTAMITYTVGSGCSVTASVTVHPAPAAIVGEDHLCVAQSTGLSDPYSGGSWSSSNSLVAPVSTTGVVAGVSAGTAVISYALTTGCYSAMPFTVVPVPGPITGTANLCVGASEILSDVTSGGTWSSSNLSLATISGTGTATALASGTVLVSYTMGTGCTTVSSLIINPISPVNGPSVVCAGQSILLSDTTVGGTWGSESTSIAIVASIGDTTAMVTGVSAGPVVIIYTSPAGCTATKTITVNPVPPAISGAAQMCVGQSTTFTDGTSGGAWSSSLTSVATVTSVTGVVTGIDAGVARISYSIGGCPALKTITVNPLPAAIAGNTSICLGLTTLLTDATSGGSWSSSSTLIAPVGATSGVVTGEAIGRAIIVYTLSTGCSVFDTVYVNPAPDAIVGTPNFCIGSTALFTDATGTGTWSSSAAGIATVGATTGLVTGMGIGTASIIYTIGTGCTVNKTVNIISLPPAILGSPNVCVGSHDTLTDADLGGTWISGSSAIASVIASAGIVTGVLEGSTVITYTLGAGCTVYQPIVVNPLPSAITGASQMCITNPVTLTDATGGGAWSSTSTSVATVNSASGVVTGVSPGIDRIVYTLGTGCNVGFTVSVSPTPTTFTGNLIVCLGSTSSLHESVPGGAWFSDRSAIAVVDTAGVVFGLGLGTSDIIYSIGPGCTAQSTVTVVAPPNAFTVTGGGNYCADGFGVLMGLAGSDPGTNYILYRGSTATGTFHGTGYAINFGLQMVAGVYTVRAVNTTTGCDKLMSGSATVSITPMVTPSVNITSGVDSVCAGASITYTAIPAGGGSTPSYIWNVNGTNVATGTSYTYIPAEGDSVKVTMHSMAACASPDTAFVKVSKTVMPKQNPYVSFNANPGDTVCRGMAMTLSAVPVYGGSAPTFTWIKDGVVIGAGPVLSYIPANNDTVSCAMTSNYPCLVTSAVTGPKVVMTVESPIIPSVTISANPGTVIGRGKSVTLTAIVTNGGTNPSFQWYVNSVPVPGATAQTFTRSNFDSTFEDSVSVVVTSSGVCPMPTHNWVYIEVSPESVKTLANACEISIQPNPNKGSFVVKGTIGTADEELTVEMTDILGAVVYQGKIVATGGKVNERIMLNNSIANGVYILNLHTATDNVVFHVVVDQ